MLKVGLRVIRGSFWPWDDEGGDIGGAGTVCEIGKPGSERSSGKTVVVQWDNGDRRNYQGTFDLRILDNAQCGVRHTNVACDSCKEKGIIGFRYKCHACFKYNLCSRCYHNNVHLEHRFTLYDTPESIILVNLPPRKIEERKCIKGIFHSAIVQRGHDWAWYMYDGGEGREGYVTKIGSHKGLLKSWRSVAHVTWHNGISGEYRVGCNGKMDLKYTKPSSGGQYYIDHLPIFSQITANHASGDHVKVFVDIKTLKRLQREHGGYSWNPRMEEDIEKVGIVQITDSGDVAVKYEGCAEPWKFHPSALKRVWGNTSGRNKTIPTITRQQYEKSHASSASDEAGIQHKMKERLDLARAISRSLAERKNEPGVSKIKEMEDAQDCSICMEEQRSIAFLCGHQACTNCAAKLAICHICRKPITHRIKLH